jgi:hypothetical protein
MNLTPDAEQVEAQRARTLLELAGVYVRQVLQLPDDVAALRTLVAELLLEVAMLRLKVDALERRAGVGR